MSNEYKKLILQENILTAWKKFSSGKSNKKEVIEFWRYLENNIFSLHEDLRIENYQHGDYKKFIVCDPKKRLIHKANVRDRVVHQLIFDYLQPFFEKRFIFDSYSSRIRKGTHRAIRRLDLFCRCISRNNERACWILKGDIEKFFDNIDHKILFSFIEKFIIDKQILRLAKKIIDSYYASTGKGLPLGNLTSQLFANIYLHELDYFIKYILRVKHYVRFNDDFIIAHSNKIFLEILFEKIQEFLENKLALSLPKSKISIRKFSWGIDFLGCVILPCIILPKTKTKKRIIKKIFAKYNQYQSGKICYNKFNQAVVSYLGLLKHHNSFKLSQKILRYV